MNAQNNIKILFFSLVASAAFMYSGCGSNPQSLDNSFDSLCKISGGSKNGARCSCGGITCEPGVVCNAGMCADNCSETHLNHHYDKCFPDAGNNNVLVYSCARIKTEDGMAFKWKQNYTCAQECERSLDNDSGNIVDGDFCRESCTDNASKCSNNSLFLNKCSNGQWISEFCSNGCIEVNGEAKCNPPECGTGESRCWKEDGLNIAQRCENNVFVKKSSCGLNSCISENENGEKIDAVCGECRNNDTRCNAGIPQTCVNGKWKGDTPCSGNASCKLTWMISEDKLVERSECGECQNSMLACINAKDIDGHDVGYLSICKNGSFDEYITLNNNQITVGSCAEDDACLLKPIFKKCQEDSCVCGERNCSQGQYCRENSTCYNADDTIDECMDYPCFRRSAFVKCEDETCTCGDETCIYNQFCKNNMQCVDGTSNYSKCTNNASCAYKYDMCLYDTGCECGDHNCSFGEYCKDGTCVKSTELDNTVQNDWVCGDCQNNPELSVSLQLCGSDNVTSNCHNDALLNIPVSMTKTCMASASINNCIQSIFEVSCLLSTCQRFRSKSSCADFAAQCWHTKYPYYECGIANENAYYFKRDYEPCTDETCTCGTQTCENGQICWENNENKACFDKDSNNVKTCLEESCPCGDSSCTQNQYCVNDQKCVDKLVDIGAMVDCGTEPCSFCQDESCTCGDRTCRKLQYCVGSGSSECKTISEMQLVPVNLCKNEACRCGKVATCKSGQYCVDEKRCVDSIPETNAIYEFVDSYGHVCKQFMGDCDANMVALDTCIENNQKDYKKCIDQCGQEKCAATCTQSDCQLDCDNCKAACSNTQSAADDRCMLDAKGKSEEPVGILARFADDVTCTPSSAGTSSTSTCHYSCTSGRYIPFRASTSCDGQ
jgi:hypothetical protein